jgi:uncharacterized protein
MKNAILIIPILVLLLFACGQTNNITQRSSWVYDYEEVLTDAQELLLDSLIKDFEKRTTNEIALITAHNIGESKSMMEHAIMLGDSLRVGKKDKNNGLVILFSRNLRKTFLATGYGTEKILKDEICKKIIDSTIIPYYKQEDYFNGLKAGVLDCINRWEKAEAKTAN